jgi:hypothetical protein
MIAFPDVTLPELIRLAFALTMLGMCVRLFWRKLKSMRRDAEEFANGLRKAERSRVPIFGSYPAGTTAKKA